MLFNYSISSFICFIFVVFEILLRVSEGKSFKEAFEMILPKRINIQPTKNEEDEKEENKES